MEYKVMVTAKQAKEMREAREAGETLIKIAARFGVSITTVQRHTDEEAAEKQRNYIREYSKKLYHETKADPERYADLLARRRKTSAKYRKSLKEMDNG